MEPAGCFHCSMQLTMSQSESGIDCPPFWLGASEGKSLPQLSRASRVEAPERVMVPRIALVDDDKELHLFLKDLADLGNFEFADSCYTATEALDRLPGLRPDAVIMDIRLPDLSGIDCTAKLQTVLPRLPIEILTGYPDSQNFFRALMQGARGFLVKPVSAQEFLDAI